MSLAHSTHNHSRSEINNDAKLRVGTATSHITRGDLTDLQITYNYTMIVHSVIRHLGVNWKLCTVYLDASPSTRTIDDPAGFNAIPVSEFGFTEMANHNGQYGSGTIIVSGKTAEALTVALNVGAQDIQLQIEGLSALMAADGISRIRARFPLVAR